MDSKVLAIIAVIGVVAIGAVAGVVLMNNDGGGKTTTTATADSYEIGLTSDSGKATVSSVDTKLVVFGNANNDVYLNSDDVAFIQKIVDGTATWNKTANPLADTNADGAITADDVTLLQRFIDKKESSMFYLDSYLKVNKVKWPMTGKIAVGGDNDVELLKIYGMQDRVGYNPGTYPYVYENVVASGATITLGQPFMYDDTFDNLVKNGYSSFAIDTVKLCEARLMNNIEGVTCTVTLGALLNAYGHGTYDQYLTYAQNVQDIVTAATQNLTDSEKQSYILLTTHSCNSASDLGMDTMSTAVMNYADVATVNNLKMVPAYPVTSEGYITGLSIENILTHSPDVIFIEAVSCDTYATFTAKVAEVAQWFKDAGYTGKIIGITYNVMGNASSTSALPLLASYIYGESVYAEADGWQQLVTYYNTFLGGSYTVDSIKETIYAAYVVE